jgi:hypothetical protein
MREFNKAQHATAGSRTIKSYKGKVKACKNLMHFKISK